MHVITGKAVAFAEALKPDFKAYGRRVVDNARALAAALAGGGVASDGRVFSGRERQPVAPSTHNGPP